MDQDDILIIGAGPAGLSAAITARRRNKTVAVIGKEEFSNKLHRAHQVDNYPGLPSVRGEDLANRLRQHAIEVGASLHLDEAQTLSPMEEKFTAYGRKGEYQARSIILATGVAQHPGIAGEESFLGRGVSYCATCDGMFFRGRPVAVIGYLPAAVEEALFLAEICSHVYYLPQYKLLTTPPKVEVVEARPVAVTGENSVSGLRTDQGNLAVAAVFIEREALPLDRLMPGLALAEGFIAVDRRQQTNLPGVFAAGDCTGRPWQIARAVGEGQVAALSAVDYLAQLKPAMSGSGKD